MSDITLVVNPPAQFTAEVTPGYPEAATATAAANAAAVSAAAAAASEVASAGNESTASTAAATATAQAEIATNQAAIATSETATATAQATISTNQAAIATAQAAAAADSAAAAAASEVASAGNESTASTAAATATAQAEIATNQAAIATSETATATAQATISTNQAAIATAQAAAAAASATSASAALPHGHCRLNFVSTTQLQLVPYDGNQIIINGVSKTIPSGGVTLSNTGLAQFVVYYIYVFMSGSTMTLEASTTAWALDSTGGIRIKSGDATRTFVGWAYTVGGSPGTFADNTGSRFVVSWFNRQPALAYAGQVSGSIGNVTAYTEINSGGRINFFCTGEEAIEITMNGNGANNVAGITVYSNIAVDSSTNVLGYDHVWAQYANSANYWAPQGMSGFINPGEGFHYATVVAKMPGGSGTCTFNTGIQAIVWR